jgi:hygromycin-B 4-O-kinase
MIAQPSLTADMIQHFLEEWHGAPVTNLALLGAGAWSRAYRFEVAGSAYVIRWSQFADNFERDTYAIRYANRDLPIPPMTALGETHGSYYAISPFVEGAFFEDLATSDLEATIPSLLRLLRALRRVDLSETHGFGFWDGQGIAAYPTWRAFVLDDKNDSPGSLIIGWRAKLEASSMGTDAYGTLRAALIDTMERVPDIRGLVHSDLLNRNVLATPGRITALLDWGSPFCGVPLYDIAWFVFYEPWYPNFAAINLAQRLLDDYRADPLADQREIDARLRGCLLDIGIGSIAYNAFIENWTNGEEAASYTLSLLG